MTKNKIGTTGTYATLFVTKMHTTRLKTGAKSETASSANDTVKGTMTIMVSSTINLTDTVPRKEDAMRAGSKLSSTT
jgi:hypothetical protein